MHHTFEDVQRSATPLVRGPLKVYLVLVALVVTVSAGNVLSHAVAGILFLGLTIHAVGIGPIRWMGVPVLFLVPGLAIILVFTPGDPLATWWVFDITDAGVQTATATLSRSLASLAILSFLVASTPVPAVVTAIRNLRVPSIIVELFFYVYRAIQVLLDEAMRMRTAARARAGFGSRRATYRNTKLIASTVLVRAFDRIERFGDALRARNHDGTLPVHSGFENAGFGYAIAIIVLLLVVRLL